MEPKPTTQPVPAPQPAQVPVASKPQEPTFKSKLNIKVFSPFKTFYSAEAYSLSAENDTGPFDVLAGHHNFLSLIKPGVIKIRDDNGVQSLTINKGLLHVSRDVVTVFLDV